MRLCDFANKRCRRIFVESSEEDEETEETKGIVQ